MLLQASKVPPSYVDHHAALKPAFIYEFFFAVHGYSMKNVNSMKNVD